MRLPFVRRCWPLLLAAPLWLGPVSLGQAQAPSLGRSLPALGDGHELSLSEERRLGDQIARAIYRDPDYLDDPVLDGYLQALWRPLVAAARERGDLSPDLAERFAWEIMIGRDRSVNAFALPGGYLGVHLGLLATVASADELASVLAHELSHVSQRHIARLIARQSQQAPWIIASMILGALAASAAKNADIANAAIVGGQAVAAQSQLNFSRDMEREADRVGFGIMTDAGFDGHGFVSMFDKLQQASRLNDDGAFPYLRSHPLTTERLADMRARVPQHDHAAPGRTGPAPVSATYHALMSARARVLSEPDTDRLRALAQTLNASNGPRDDPATLGQRYAATLAAARLRDGARVWTGLTQLRASLPPDADAQWALRWLELEVLPGASVPAAQAAATAQHLAQLRDRALADGQRSSVLVAARSAVGADAGVQRSAIQRLQTWTALHPRDASAWQTLAVLQQAQGQPERAARATAEARLAHLDAPGALERFKAAQQLARGRPGADHIELSILDARVRDTERLVREQLREAEAR
ncbi:M48 family metalloprotease [Aquabacterium sp. A08]|uniref:M48 family metalloprotease n=1 Tax=Aquabacterium sp. A08 TaxID=2718532 RepID=UPI001424A059|nr:M48 family metalloprotease [Aquabacterium sp. A08]NIC40933.1 M48 family metalloprotease [Aquabacterium sp. A08]